MSFRFHDGQNPLNQGFRLLHWTSVNNLIWHTAWRSVCFDHLADHLQSSASIVARLTAFLERGGASRRAKPAQFHNEFLANVVNGQDSVSLACRRSPKFLMGGVREARCMTRVSQACTLPSHKVIASSGVSSGSLEMFGRLPYLAMSAARWLARNSSLKIICCTWPRETPRRRPISVTPTPRLCRRLISALRSSFGVFTAYASLVEALTRPVWSIID
jgi:hypothetical protein